MRFLAVYTSSLHQASLSFYHPVISQFSMPHVSFNIACREPKNWTNWSSLSAFSTFDFSSFLRPGPLWVELYANEGKWIIPEKIHTPPVEGRLEGGWEALEPENKPSGATFVPVFIASIDMIVLKNCFAFSNVTSHGKTYTNGYPSKWQKALDKRLLSVKTLYQTINLLDKPFSFLPFLLKRQTLSI